MDCAARHHLAVLSGPGVGWVLPLTGGLMVVGRGADADLVLADPRLSRAHLQVRDRRGQVRIRDLGSANGTRIVRARGTQATSAPPRLARRSRRVGHRWQPLPVGSRVFAGSTVLELRVHPGMVLPVELEEQTDFSGGLLGRLMLPLLMSVSALPLLLGGGGGVWRLVLLIALPVVLIVAILWPALRDRARRLRRTGRQEEREPPVPQPMIDPAALLAAAGAPVALPDEGPRWEIGNANVRAPVPRRPGHMLRGKTGRRAEQMRFIPVPEPGSGLALVGAAEPVEALGRWLAVRHHALTGEPVGSPWPELATLGEEDRDARTGPLLRVLSSPERGLAAPTDSARHLVLVPTVTAVPRWCSAVLEVRIEHDRRVGPDWAAAVLAELRSSYDGGASVPTSVHLGDLLGQAGETSRSVAAGALPAVRTEVAAAFPSPRGETGVPLPAGWSEPGVRAPLGVGRRGPVWLDLAEHGPHALVAGTTGSGKSELLLAWILGLAHQASPADTQFVLFDYKGGATFTPLRKLAHVVGVLTDLDDAATARALASLQAELRARERALATVGAHDLTEQRRRTSGPDRLGRLLVVVDEFRVMADAHPEQLDALVRLAAQGRSLGIHLVLATQRPGGAITPDMRANLTVRACLRVLEDTDSLDMLGDSSAARLPRIPGRAVLRTEEAEQIQTAWCGEVADGWVAGRVAALNAAAEQLAETEPWRQSLRRPWAPPLPEDCRVEDLDAYRAQYRTPSREGTRPGGPTPGGPQAAGGGGTEGTQAAGGGGTEGTHGGGTPGYPMPWALLDLPDEQRLGARWFAGGTLLVSGPPGSGRSTALHTITESALRGGTAVHVIAEDAQEQPGAHAPAAGTWCPSGDPRRVRRLLERLLDGASPGLLVLDDVDAVADALDETGTPGEGADLVLSVLRRARRLGLDVAIGATEGSRRWAGVADRQLLLCPRDPADAVLAGAPRELVGAGWPPGRCVLLDRGDAWVAQVLRAHPEPKAWQSAERTPLRLVALPAFVRLGDAPDTREAGPIGPAAAGEARPTGQPEPSPPTSEGETVPSAGPTRPPAEERETVPSAGPTRPPAEERETVPSAGPTRPPAEEVAQRRTPAQGGAPTNPVQVLLGRGGDDAGWLRRALVPGSTWLVCGPPGSGRSTALTAITTQLDRAGWQVLDARTPVPPAAGRGPTPGAVLVLDDADRIPGAAAEQWATYLSAHPDVAVLGAGRAETMATSFHPITIRLREPDLSLVLADPRPAHLPSVDLRAVQDPLTRPGRGVLVDSAGAVPLQVTTAEGAAPPD